MSSIKVSKKHGVNPSLDVCFWCGEAKGILLMGALKNDAEAPRNSLTNYEPCDKCRAQFDQGVWLAEVNEHPNIENQFPIQNEGSTSLYPTGRYIVVSHRFAENAFNVKIESKAFLDKEAFDSLMSHIDRFEAARKAHEEKAASEAKPE